MAHVPKAVLRRLLDEPAAVAGAAAEHLAGCRRCQRASERIADDAAFAAYLLAAPQMISDTDAAWASLQRRLTRPGTTGPDLPGPAVTAPAARLAVSRPRRTRRLVNASLVAGALVAAAVLAAGVAATLLPAGALAPERVAPAAVRPADLRAVAAAVGIGTSPWPGRSSAGGWRRLPFGMIGWSAAGRARPVASMVAARALTHLAVSAPRTLPGGAGALHTIVVQPGVTVTIRFRAGSSPAPDGGTLIITDSPAVLVQYAGVRAGLRLTTLRALIMRQPVASSAGASASRLETFLLSRRGLPAGLAREIWLLDHRGGLLAWPGPPGPAGAALTAEHARIAGSPGMVIGDVRGAASGVLWESPGGVIHAVAALLGRAAALRAARQLG